MKYRKNIRYIETVIIEVSEDRVKKKIGRKKKDLRFIEMVIVELSEDTIGKKNSFINKLLLLW